MVLQSVLQEMLDLTTGYAALPYAARDAIEISYWPDAFASCGVQQNEVGRLALQVFASTHVSRWREPVLKNATNETRDTVGPPMYRRTSRIW